MPKKKQRIEKCEGPDFEVGAVVCIQRPNLFAGVVGTVVAVEDHRHLIRAKSNYFAQACGSDLRLEESP